MGCYLSLLKYLGQRYDKHRLQAKLLTFIITLSCFSYQCGYTIPCIYICLRRRIRSRLFITTHTLLYSYMLGRHHLSYRRAPNFITGSVSCVVYDLHAKCVNIPDHAFDAWPENLFTWTVHDSRYKYSRVTTMSKHLRIIFFTRSTILAGMMVRLKSPQNFWLTCAFINEYFKNISYQI